VVETLEEIKEQLRRVQTDPSVDLLQSFASMLHQEQRRFANALLTVGQCNEVIARQSATLVEQSRTIQELRTKIAELSA
jgi:hypothetical protein